MAYPKKIDVNIINKIINNNGLYHKFRNLKNSSLENQGLQLKDGGIYSRKYQRQKVLNLIRKICRQ